MNSSQSQYPFARFMSQTIPVSTSQAESQKQDMHKTTKMDDNPKDDLKSDLKIVVGDIEYDTIYDINDFKFDPSSFLRLITESGNRNIKYHIQGYRGSPIFGDNDTWLLNFLSMKSLYLEKGWKIEFEQDRLNVERDNIYIQKCDQ